MASKTRLDHQKHLEELYSKNQLIPRLRKEFMECDDFDFKQYLDNVGIPQDFGISLLVQMALHKRADVQTLIGLLRHHCEDAQETADMLERAIQYGLVSYDETTSKFVVNFTISDQVQDELDRFQYPLPMVVKPNKLESNLDSGYLLERGSVILKDNHHMDDVCLDHINRVNRIRFTLNLDTVSMIKNTWRNLDKPKQGESQYDFQRRVRAFEKYDRTAHDVIGLLIQEGNMFYLTHKYDKRGRIYCQGYHVNYQGTAWNKAVVEFADKEIVE
jgi:hypothetical protein